MNFFGPDCSPPSESLGEKVEVPVGRTCFGCDRTIEEGDSGFVLPFVGGDGDPSDAPYHRACLAKNLGVELRR